ncbi:MAG: nitroreductase [Pseudomonadota bacterium]
MTPLPAKLEVLDFLATRRSTAAKTLTAPGPEGAALSDLLTLASRVPDHGKLAPWRFVAVTGDSRGTVAEAALTRLADLGEDATSIEKARAVWATGATIVAVIFSPRESAKIPLWEQELAAGCVCLTLVNAALASGWGANWLSGKLSRDQGFLAETLGCAPGEWAPGFIHLGTPRITPAERDRPDAAALTTWL